MRFLEQARNGITGDLVKAVHEAHASKLNALQAKFERYKGENLPIETRDYGDRAEPDIDAVLKNDFFGKIVDTKVGHFAGKPASYSYDKTRAEHERAYDLLSRFQVVNNIAHIDAQTTKDAAICGKAYRLLYVNPEKELRVTTLRPYEVVTLYENDPTESEFAFRFYLVEQADGEMVLHADVYDQSYMYEYVDGENGFTLINKRLHLFEHCPVILYQNNDEEQGDADKVISLIDAYDRAFSDMSAEITAFRLAYLAVIGGQLTKDAVEQMHETGALNVPDGVDIKFIIKQLLDTPIENHFNRLETNIFDFSKTPNTRDERFSQNSSGIALKYKLSDIEAKSLTFERIKTYADIRQFKVASTYWVKKERVALDPYSVVIEHNRNVPIDLNEIADAVTKYNGILPMEIILTLMPFIDDPQYVLDLIEQEKESMREMDNDTDLDNEVGEDDNEQAGQVSETAQEVAE